MSNLREQIKALLALPALSGFATVTAEGKPWVRYVMAVMDDTMTVRFATFINARKVAHIKHNPEVHITAGVCDPSKDTNYVQIQGTAQFTADETARHAFWHPMLKGVFSGPDDPNYGIVAVTPYRIEYWSAGSMEPKVWEAE
jgi:general stress protein 26